MEMTYEVGLNIGIELMKEEKVKSRPFVCWFITSLILLYVFFLWNEPRSDY